MDISQLGGSLLPCVSPETPNIHLALSIKDDCDFMMVILIEDYSIHITLLLLHWVRTNGVFVRNS